VLALSACRGWHSPPGWRRLARHAGRRATGLALFGALAIAFQSVIWSYYGYGDAAKIAEEVVDPGRTLPRVFLFGIAIATGLYLLLNAAFPARPALQSARHIVLVAGDVASTIFGAHGNLAITVLALLVVLASLNGNIFVTARVIFGLARKGWGHALLAEVNAGGTPSEAMLSVESCRWRSPRRARSCSSWPWRSGSC